MASIDPQVYRIVYTFPPLPDSVYGIVFFKSVFTTIHGQE